MIRAGAYPGCFSLIADMPEAGRARRATEYVFGRMPHHVCIMNSSILAAVAGNYGDYHTTDRTAGSELYVNPLMAIYWGFRLGPVVRRVQYLDAVRPTETWEQVRAAIFTHLATRPPARPWRDLPL